MKEPTTPRVTYLKQVFDSILTMVLMVVLVIAIFTVQLAIDKGEGVWLVRGACLVILAVLWLLPAILTEQRRQRKASQAEWDAYELYLKSGDAPK